MAKRLLFYRVHVWLSWFVGLQIVIWVATGLFMAASPIETVRGEHLARKPETIDLRGVTVQLPGDIAAREKKPVERLLLKTWLGRPTYEIHYAGGGAALVDAVSGKRLSPLTGIAAEMAARAVYAGREPEATATRVDPKAIPLELRRDEPAWAVRFHSAVVSTGGTIFYVSAETGEVLARRTGRWRLYDLMWGLHIMDYGGRTNFNTPWLIVLSVLSLVSVVVGGALLFMRKRWRP